MPVAASQHYIEAWFRFDASKCLSRFTRQPRLSLEPARASKFPSIVSQTHHSGALFQATLARESPGSSSLAEPRLFAVTHNLIFRCKQVYDINHTMTEREQLAFLIRQYKRLQTLKLAPFPIILIALPWISVRRVSGTAFLIGLGVCAAVCIIWYWLLNRYYEQRYGRVQEKWDWSSWNKRRSFNLLQGVVILVTCIYLVISGRLPSLAFCLLLLSAIFLGEGLLCSENNLRRCYYFVAGVFVLLVSLSALIGSSPGHQFFHFYDGVFVGVALLMVSIFDHLLLVHSFNQPHLAVNA
jgi:hypothetical protein